MKVKEESEKAGLKLNIQKTKIMATGPITSWQINRKKWKQWQISFSWAPKITVDGDYSHKIRMLAPWRKSYEKTRQSIKKQRHHFAKKVLYSQSYVFSSSHVWMWELWRIDVLNCGAGEDLRVHWAARRSNQSVLKETLNIHWTDWCWSWSSNTLDTWCEELTHWKRPWCWERLRARGEEDDRGWDGWTASLTQWTWVWANSGRWWRTGKPGML